MHPHLDPVIEDGEVTGYAFWCPGCAQIDAKHGFHVFTTESDDVDQRWDFDGHDSFEPSLAYESSPGCHLHLRAGRLHYYPDCEHGLAGQVVPLVEFPTGEHEERE